MPSVGVVIATCRRHELLRGTLESLARTRRASELDEVVVVENGGAHGAEAVVREFDERLPMVYVLQEVGGKCRALNAAVARSDVDLVYFLDDDVRLDDATLEAYLDAAGRYGRGHHFSGPLVAEWEKEPPEWLKPFLPASAVGWDKGNEEIYYDRPWFIGSNWAVYREDILAAGEFREQIGPGSPTGTVGDETDLQKRLLAAGGRGVYLPEALVWHHVPAADCDYDWALRRQRRHGKTYGFMGWTPYEGPVREGLTGWAILGWMALKAGVKRALGWSRERRAWLEMTCARTHGYLEGRRLARRHPR